MFCNKCGSKVDEDSVFCTVCGTKIVTDLSLIHILSVGSISKSKPQYKECTVCQEWWNFCNFEKWYDEHYYEIEDEIMDLDKDILFKGNKEYGPNTCCVIPHYINTCLLYTSKADSI